MKIFNTGWVIEYKDGRKFIVIWHDYMTLAFHDGVNSYEIFSRYYTKDFKVICDITFNRSAHDYACPGSELPLKNFFTKGEGRDKWIPPWRAPQNNH